jgi:hypothetical protein
LSLYCNTRNKSCYFNRLASAIGTAHREAQHRRHGRPAEPHSYRVDFVLFFFVGRSGTASANSEGATNREEAMNMKIAEKFEAVMMAAAFAEENEHGTARELLTGRRESDRVAKRPAVRPQPRQTLRAD